jgi:hypothetical protein
VAVTLLGVAACGDDDTAGAGTTAQGSRDAGASSDGDASDLGTQVGELIEGSGVDEVQATIGESVHYAGFVFDLGDATLAPSENAVDIEGTTDSTVGQLTIEATIENLGPEDAAPDQADMHMELDGSAIDLDPFTFEGLPVVPGGSTTNAEIVFDGLPADFSIKGAELVFGDGTVNQARVPLDGEGETVTLAPLDITTGAAGQAGEITFNVTSGNLSYGDPAFHVQLDEGTAVLTLEYTITGSPGLWSGSGGVNVGWGNVRLILPDGTSLADTVTGGSSNEILLPSATVDGMITRYEVPADVRGSLQLALAGRYGTGCCEEVEGMATLELPA